MKIFIFGESRLVDFLCGVLNLLPYDTQVHIVIASEQQLSYLFMKNEMLAFNNAQARIPPSFSKYLQEFKVSYGKTRRRSVLRSHVSEKLKRSSPVRIGRRNGGR